MTAPGGGHAGLAARVALRPVGNPLPLGFLAPAAATLLVRGLQLGRLAPTDGAAVGLMLVAFVVPLQLVAALLGSLPLGRRAAGAESVGGGPEAQLRRIEREAGVREQL